MSIIFFGRMCTSIGRKFLAFWVWLFFPRRCFYCNKIIGTQECKECPPKLPIAKRVDDNIPLGTKNCMYVTRAVAPYFYTDPIDTAIKRLKFKVETRNIEPFVQALSHSIKFAYHDVAFDVCTVVPSAHKVKRQHNDRLPFRLAREICIQKGITLSQNLLYKNRKTKRQMQLSGKERRKNLNGAFTICENATVKGKSILLIDDVLTTGSTVGECAKVLRKAGAKNVYVATIALAKV